MMEKDIQRKILQWLNAQEGCYFFKVAQGAYSTKGVSDLVGVVNGMFVALEVKTPKGRVTPLQQNFIDRVKSEGGHAYVIRSLEDAEDVITVAKGFYGNKT